MGSLPSAAQRNSQRSSRSSGGIQGSFERVVHLFFRAAGDVFFFAFFDSFAGDLEYAVFVDFQAAIFGHAAQHDVVGLGAGEIDQRRAVGIFFDDAQIDLQADAQADRHFRGAAREHGGDAVELGEAVHHLLGVFAFDDGVEIADGFAAAAVAAGHVDLLDAGAGFQMRQQHLSVDVGFGPVHAQHFGRGGEIETGENGGFGFLAEAFEFAHAAFLAGDF